MHIHILGIGGTFMSALAMIAREAGYIVSGADANCYPPVSDLLNEKGIAWTEGYDDASQALAADMVIVGNAMKRGVPVLEAVLNARKPYTSGPQWLAEHILSKYKVLAVAGTHGKTTTTSMAAFIMEQAGLKPGFLIGGVSPNLNTSAQLGEGGWFVIEADEYDSAFFDKRPKFVHYRPQIAILNNLEFDHADIYDDLSAIQKQFHYFLRTIPANGTVIKPRDDNALDGVITMGQFSAIENRALTGTADWRAELSDEAGQAFRVWYQGQVVCDVNWSLIGRFNVDNALSAIAACYHAGVSPQDAARALEAFKPVKRRLEIRSEAHGVTIYDDFAHHPTAIEKTIQALVSSERHQCVYVVLEFASYTMKTGVHTKTINQAISGADGAFVLTPSFDLTTADNFDADYCQLLPDTKAIVSAVVAKVNPGDAILVMSNRSFDNIFQKLIEAVGEKYTIHTI